MTYSYSVTEVVEEWQSGNGITIPAETKQFGFRGMPLAVGSVALKRGGIARHWRGALSAAVTSVKRTEFHGERRHFGGDCGRVESTSAKRLTIPITQKKQWILALI